MNVRIYIDGYNLYYGALKRTEFKWLDPVKLIKHVIITSAPEHLLPLENAKFFTKYFTSPVEPAYFGDSEQRFRSYPITC